MSKKRINWKEIAARYIDGESPKDIARDYLNCDGKKIGDKASQQGWTKKKREILESVVNDHSKETADHHKTMRRRLLEEMGKIAFADMGDYVEVHEGGEIIVKTFDAMPEGASKAIKGIKEKRRILMSDADGEGDNMILDSQLELTHHDKLKAIEMMGRWLGIDKPPADDNNDDGPKAITLKIVHQRGGETTCESD